MVTTSGLCYLHSLLNETKEQQQVHRLTPLRRRSQALVIRLLKKTEPSVGKRACCPIMACVYNLVPTWHGHT